MTVDWRRPPRFADALERAQRLQALAATQGFDWPTLAPMWSKLSEEIAELQEAIAGGRQAEIHDEIGDLLFMVVNLARFVEVDPGGALDACCDKFGRRLAWIQAELSRQGARIEDRSLDELEALWQRAKTDAAG